MDIIYEQLLVVKKSKLNYLLMALIIILAAALGIFLFINSAKYSLLVFAIVGLIYGVMALLKQFFIEYEYIMVNGTVDVDKITAKSSRKRLLSFDTKDIIKCDKVVGGKVPQSDAKIKLVCGNLDETAYCLLLDCNGTKKQLVFSPDDRMKAAIKETAPRIISKDLFN